MRKPLPNLSFFALLFVACALQFKSHAAPAGPLVKHLSHLLRLAKSSSKTPQSDRDVIQFEDGYFVETVVEGNQLGVVPYKIRVLEDELFAVDEVNSNIVKITPPLSQYSRARLVAGSFQGYSGHMDGKPSDARFNHPKGVTMDDKGNVYVADTMNLAIRKIGDSGVTTIAGGRSSVAGYRDGPSEDAKFSNDFDVVYIQSTCSLLVIDRGNAALRQISLNQEDCDYQYSSVSTTDILMVVGTVVIGYAMCLLQQGFGSSFFSRTQFAEHEFEDEPSKEKPTPITETVKENPGWPSFGQLIIDLSKFSLEALGNIFLSFVPSRVRPGGSKKGLTPLKDSLIMPEDEAKAAKPPLVQRQSGPVPLSETRVTQKMKSSSFKDPSLSSKHRSSKRQEYTEFYNSGEVPVPYNRSKSSKERTRHRQRDRSGEVGFGMEQQPVEMKQMEYENSKFEHYKMRSKHRTSDDSFRF